MTYLIAFAVAFVDMFLRSSQQVHVYRAQYVRIWLTAAAMAFCAIYGIGLVIEAKGFDWRLALAYGWGWGAGSNAAAWLAHRRRG